MILRLEHPAVSYEWRLEVPAKRRSGSFQKCQIE
ncbi:hypothetical protein BH18ACT13_BH18ACT13_13720 [soil metagenome]